MSTGRRLWDIMRSYGNYSLDRFNEGIDRAAAYAELQGAIGKGRQAEEEVEAYVRLETRTLTDPREKRERARALLGVVENASYQEIRHAFERLSRRSNPANFPADTIERLQAIEIHRKVHWAYATLTEDIDPTEKRFRNLELPDREPTD